MTKFGSVEGSAAISAGLESEESVLAKGVVAGTAEYDSL